MRLFYWLTVLLLGGWVRGYAQGSGPPVTGTFERLSVEEFARQLEAQTPYRIFFDTAAVRGATV
ncbi:MAG: hypothetical protein EOO59_05170, partial [Hymenobacter sp.]